jgi:hypothetical protein
LLFQIQTRTNTLQPLTLLLVPQSTQPRMPLGSLSWFQERTTYFLMLESFWVGILHYTLPLSLSPALPSSYPYICPSMSILDNIYNHFYSPSSLLLVSNCDKTLKSSSSSSVACLIKKSTPTLLCSSFSFFLINRI